MENTYSLTILPSDDVIAVVKSMKEKLAEKIGWFHSKNSVGHITICEFNATDKEIKKIKSQLMYICDTLTPFEVHLNDFGSFPNGAFFISPDQDSKRVLKPVMRKFHESLSICNIQKSTNPHLSIGRRLSPENLEKAKKLFPEVELTFVCDNIVLRKFDEHIKQFSVTDSFPFNSNPTLEFIQGTLF